MTDGDVQFRQIGQHIIFHDLERAALNDMNNAALVDSFVCPNIASFVNMSVSEANVLMREHPGHEPSKDFLAELHSLDEKYGKNLLKKMRREEQQDRFNAAYVFLRRIGMVKMAERDVQWIDIEIDAHMKEMRR